MYSLGSYQHHENPNPMQHYQNAPSSSNFQNNNQRPSPMTTEAIHEARQLLSSPMFTESNHQLRTEPIIWPPSFILPESLNRETPLPIPGTSQSK